MATIIRRVSKERHLQSYIFYVQNFENSDIRVTSFYDGYAYVEPYRHKYNPEVFIKALAGCFEPDSDFILKLFKFLRINKSEKFLGFNVFMDGVMCKITLDNFEEVSKDVHQFYDKALFTFVKKLDIITDFEFKNQKAEEEWVNAVKEEARSSDWIIENIFSFARYWAKHMQYLLKNKKGNLSEIATKTYINDYNQEVTESMKECAEDLLRQYWKYGSSLDRWFSRYQDNK